MVMPRFRRALRMRPINTIKNIVDNTSLLVAAATTTTVDLAVAVNAYAGAVTDVPIGAKVIGFYLFIQIQPEVATTNVDWYIAKGNTASIGAMPTPGSTGGHVNRNLILHEEKGLPGNYTNGNSPLTFRGFIRLPRGRQMFHEGDICRVFLRGAATYSLCLKSIYKVIQ